MDLTATILDAVKAIAPQKGPSQPTQPQTVPDGLSLLPLLDGDPISRSDLFFHYPHFAFHKDNRPGSAIRSGPYKLIFNYDDSSVELYDLQDDLSESKNLSESHQELTANLLSKLDQWLTEVNADRPTPRVKGDSK